MPALALDIGMYSINESDELDDHDRGLGYGFELEINKTRSNLEFIGAPDETERDPAELTLNLIFDYQFSSRNGFRLEYEVENDSRSSGYVVESYLRSELFGFEFHIGKQDLPFGQSESEFITGPVLEFGEVNRSSLLGNYSWDSGFSATGYLFDSDNDGHPQEDSTDYGLLFSYTTSDEEFSAGIGYLSDLWEATEPLDEIEDDSLNEDVSGISGFVIAEYGDWIGMIEHVSLLDKFETFEEGFQKPSTTSMELQYFPSDRILFGVRAEFSDQLVEFPQRRYSLLFRYNFSSQISIAGEYVLGKYDPVLIEDDEDEPLENESSVSIQLLVEF